MDDLITNPRSDKDAVTDPKQLADLPIEEGEWDEELEAFSNLQHPNFVELLGLVVVPGKNQLRVTGIIMDLAGSSVTTVTNRVR
jgi:hypothetical protein